MNKVFLGLGSNIGDRSGNISAALKRISEIGNVTEVSAYFVNEAEGMAEGHDAEFVNAVCRLETSLSAIELLNFLAEVEAETGRVRSVGEKLARKIDLDILVYNEEIIQNDRLTIPHPEICNRLFVLVPFEEIAPELILPGTNESIGVLRAKLQKAKGAEKNEISI